MTEFTTMHLAVITIVAVVIISTVVTMFMGADLYPQNRAITNRLKTQINDFMQLSKEYENSSISTTLTGTNGLIQDLNKIYAKASQITNSSILIQSKPENIAYMHEVKTLTYCVNITEKMLKACDKQNAEYDKEECLQQRTNYIQSNCNIII